MACQPVLFLVKCSDRGTARMQWMYGGTWQDMFAAVRGQRLGIPWEVKVVGADIKRRVPRYRTVW